MKLLLVSDLCNKDYIISLNSFSFICWLSIPLFPIHLTNVCTICLWLRRQKICYQQCWSICFALDIINWLKDMLNLHRIATSWLCPHLGDSSGDILFFLIKKSTCILLEIHIFSLFPVLFCFFIWFGLFSFFILRLL